MRNYFDPDISMLKQIPKVESNKILNVEAGTEQPSAPDMLQVDRLLHMINFARQSGSARHGAQI